MIQRICPICDQVMDSAHYCRHCKSWVRTPWVRDVTYYLNENHPADEARCTYHGKGMAEGTAVPSGESHGGWSLRKPGQGAYAAGDRLSAQGRAGGTGPVGRAGPGQSADFAGGAGSGRSADYAGVANPGRSAGPDSRAGTGQKGKKTSRSALAVIVVILIAVKLLGSCAGYLVESAERLIEGNRTPEQEYDVDLGPFIGEEDPEGETVRELEDEEVQAEGVACSMNGHFPVQGSDVADEVAFILGRNGLEVSYVDHYSYNEEYENGDTWYSSWDSFELKAGPGGGYQYLEVDYDTATGDLHQIYISVEDGAVLANVAGDILDAMEEMGAITAEENCGDFVKVSLPAATVAGEAYQIRRGTVVAEGQAFDDAYALTISRGEPEEDMAGEEESALQE